MLIPIRDENPYRRFPLVTVLLIAASAYMFFVAAPPTDVNVFQYGSIPCDVLDRCTALSERLVQRFPGRSPWFSVLSSMFMHGNFAHLGGNMLFLWVFGNNVEDRLGHVGYALFYLVCGLAATGTHFAVSSGSPVPIVGASGAISGVLGAYYVLFPRARVLTLVPFLLFIPIEVRAGFLLGMWFLMQLLAGVGGLGMAQGPGVAFLAHVGGFAAGWLILRLIGGRPRRDPVRRWLAYDDD